MCEKDFLREIYFLIKIHFCAEYIFEYIIEIKIWRETIFQCKLNKRKFSISVC